MFDFWQTQNEQKPLFPEILWSRPEQRSRAGKLAIIGGSKGNFRGLETAWRISTKIGAGEVKIVAPDSLKKILPNNFNDVVFAPSNHSGGFSKDSSPLFSEIINWADQILLIGDCDKSSETAVLFEDLVLNSDKPIIIARDAVDLLISSYSQILDNPNITICASFSQLQKIFQNIFYPRVLTFSMQLSNLVETLHKFTFTFPCEIITFHADHLIIAEQGKIFTTQTSPLRIWTGEIPAKVATFHLWNPKKRAEASITSIIDNLDF